VNVLDGHAFLLDVERDDSPLDGRLRHEPGADLRLGEQGGGLLRRRLGKDLGSRCRNEQDR
jgi:hypothetical protein